MRVSGPLNNAKAVTDGIIAKDNAAKLEADKPENAVLVLDMQGPVFIGGISLVWNGKIKPLKRVYRGSIDIFGYAELGEPVIKKEDGGLLRETVTFKPRMLRYIQVDLSENESTDGLALYEMEVDKFKVNGITFSGMRAENVREYAAEVCWTTDIGTVAKVKYGIDKTKMEKTVTQINVEKDHRVQLTGLKKGTDYYYQIVVDNLTPEPFTSDVAAFRTAGIPLPLFTGFKTVVGNDSLEFAWSTNVATRAILELGDSVELKVKYPLGKEIADSRRVVVDNLLPSTLYRYKITCVDTFRNGMTSGVRKFRTAEHNVALGAVVEGTFNGRPDSYIASEPPIIGRITDGSTSYFKGMATSGNILRGDQWVRIDLGRAVVLDRLTVDWRQNAHSRDFTVSGSIDGSEFEPFGENLDAMRQSVKTTSETGDPVLRCTVPCDGRKTRYIRLDIKKGSKFYNKHAGRQNFVQIMEVKAYPVVKYRFKPRVREIPVN